MHWVEAISKIYIIWHFKKINSILHLLMDSVSKFTRQDGLVYNWAMSEIELSENQVALIFEASASGCTMDEAKVSAKATDSQVVGYLEKHPNFIEECKLLRLTPQIEARKTIAKGVKESPELAMKYMERKLPDEFAPVTKARIEAKLEVDDKRVILD